MECSFAKSIKLRCQNLAKGCRHRLSMKLIIKLSQFPYNILIRHLKHFLGFRMNLVRLLNSMEALSCKHNNWERQIVWMIWMIRMVRIELIIMSQLKCIYNKTITTKKKSAHNPLLLLKTPKLLLTNSTKLS